MMCRKEILLVHIIISVCVVGTLNVLSISTIDSWTRWYAKQENKSLFAVQVINFIPSGCYVVMTPIIPIVSRRMPRGLVFLCFNLLSIMGAVLQLFAVDSYWAWFTATILQSIPQPFILANLILLGDQYLTPNWRGRWMSLYTATTIVVEGVSYCVFVYYLNDLTATIWWASFICSIGVAALFPLELQHSFSP
jgi:MFS family permease